MDKPTKDMLRRVAAVFGGAALLAVTIILVAFGDEFSQLYPALAAPVATALLAPAVWWLMFVKKTKPLGLRRALVTGALIAALSHPVMVFIVMVVNLANEAPFDGADLLMQLLVAPLAFGLGTLLLGFWVTLPLGALGGFLVFKWQRAAGYDPGSDDVGEVEQKDPAASQG